MSPSWRSTIRHPLLLAALALTLGACGPLLLPMVPRPGPQQQADINTMWTNLLAPPSRENRTLLLGTLMAYNLFGTGVDRADFHAEKTVDGNRVVMDVHYLRQSPDDDAFYVTIYDPQGRLLRAERYSRADVEAERTTLTKAQMASMQLASTQPATSQQKFDWLEQEKHWRLIQAATMPAAPPAPPTHK